MRMYGRILRPLNDLQIEKMIYCGAWIGCLAMRLTTRAPKPLKVVLSPRGVASEKSQ